MLHFKIVFFARGLFLSLFLLVLLKAVILVDVCNYLSYKRDNSRRIEKEVGHSMEGQTPAL